MKRRGLAALIAALAVIAVGILISFFLSLTAKNTGNYTISLPGQSTAAIDDMGLIREKNRETVQAVTLSVCLCDHLLLRRRLRCLYRYDRGKRYAFLCKNSE